MKDRPLSKNERDFIVSALRDGVRVDGRAPNKYRPVAIEYGPAIGAVEVRIGFTRVMCRVTCEVVEPTSDRASEGQLKFVCECSSMAAPSFESGRPSDITKEIERILERALKTGRMVDTEALCILAGKMVWCLRVDVTVLDHGGNLVDGCVMAAVCALLHFRKPDVSISGEDVVVHPLEEREPIPLSIHHAPLAVTYALFEGGDLLALDPSEREEMVMDGKISCVCNVHGDLCFYQKQGGPPLSMGSILRIARDATQRVKELLALVKQSLLNAGVKQTHLPDEIPVTLDLPIPKPVQSKRSGHSADAMADEDSAGISGDETTDQVISKGANDGSSSSSGSGSDSGSEDE
eukprot:Rmarinus@m.2562